MLKIGGFGQIKDMGSAPVRNLLYDHTFESIKAEGEIYDFKQYRNYGIDTTALDNLYNACNELSRIPNLKLWIVAGGTGAFMFIDLARRLGFSAQEQQRIGVEMSQIYSEIVMKALGARGVRIHPKLVDISECAEASRDDSVCYVARPSSKSMSTDALGCAIAANHQVDFVVFKSYASWIEKIWRYIGFGSEVPSHIDISELKHIMRNRIDGPGQNFFLDKQSIEIIEDRQINLCLYDTNKINELTEIYHNRLEPILTIIGRKERYLV
ncbi:hypothetical protein [Azospirillum sp. TSO22-1]|uniref:hypothetical protein n=1 Tax=Azospirillum sp. TSO22-1 TaxID=716789 RepID=UPI0011B425FF|nr:hypothetical protein [Azospirillum sp. TSO22-1]